MKKRELSIGDHLLRDISGNAMTGTSQVFKNLARQGMFQPDLDERKPMGYQFRGSDTFTTDLLEAIDMFTASNGEPPKSFLDVGSGVGATLFLAAQHFPDAVHGVEFNQHLVSVFQWLYHYNRFHPEYTKLYTFTGWAESFTKYHEYDVVYHFNISMPKDVGGKAILEDVAAR